MYEHEREQSQTFEVMNTKENNVKILASLVTAQHGIQRLTDVYTMPRIYSTLPEQTLTVLFGPGGRVAQLSIRYKNSSWSNGRFNAHNFVNFAPIDLKF